jgi:alanyl-tRNA synthetase
MQQHTGQHILSQAFERTFGWQTKAFHLGREVVTIDIDTVSLITEQVAQVEYATNQVVFENRPVHSYFVAEDSAAGLDLRKLPTRHGELRIVEIEQFDRIPCGGTHCRRTGQVGIIKILRHERRGAETRVEFVCGGRALADYRWRNDALKAIGDALNTSTRETPGFILKVLSDRDLASKKIEAMREQLLKYESADLASKARQVGDIEVAEAILLDRPPDELKWLAQNIILDRPCLALLGSINEGKGHLVFARSEALSVDVGSLLKEVTTAVGGRGGGRKDTAQGGAPPDRLVEAIAIAIRIISSGR